MLRDVPCPSEKGTNGQAFALSLSLPRRRRKSSRTTSASLFAGKYGKCGSAVPLSVFLLSLLLQHGGNVSASLAIRSSCRNSRAGIALIIPSVFLSYRHSVFKFFVDSRQIGGSYKCTPCDFWCDENDAMDSHLSSTSHRDVVSMMNGSVPVVVGRQRALPCHTCDRRFRYNFQLRMHVKETGHEGSFTASDEYQQRIKCDRCAQIVRSLVALQRHRLTCHGSKSDERGERDESNDSAPAGGPYFCSFCSMNFSTSQEAVLHRRTSSHKEIVKARKNGQGPSSTSTMRECPHCKGRQSNLSEHKEHLLQSHPELCHR